MKLQNISYTKAQLLDMDVTVIGHFFFLLPFFIARPTAVGRFHFVTRDRGIHLHLQKWECAPYGILEYIFHGRHCYNHHNVGPSQIQM